MQKHFVTEAHWTMSPELHISLYYILHQLTSRHCSWKQMYIFTTRDNFSFLPPEKILYDASFIIRIGLAILPTTNPPAFPCHQQMSRLSWVGNVSSVVSVPKDKQAITPSPPPPPLIPPYHPHPHYTSIPSNVPQAPRPHILVCNSNHKILLEHSTKKIQVALFGGYFFVSTPSDQK